MFASPHRPALSSMLSRLQSAAAHGGEVPSEEIKSYPSTDDYPGLGTGGAASAATHPGVAVGSMGSIGDGRATLSNFLCKSAHPIASFFHLAFKLTAMILYLFCNWFGLDFVTTFVLCVLLLAFDFWTVKNVTGRLLVGLRWWNRIRDDGANEWIFESHPVGSVVIDAMDSRIFWGALYGAPAVWFLFSFLAIIGLKLDWLLICAVGLSLTGANVYGYFKCSTDAQRQLQATLTSGALSFFPGGGNGGILSTVAAAAGTNALTLVAGAAAASALSGTQAARAAPTTATAPTLLDAAPTSSRFQGAPDGLTVEPLSPSGTRVRPLATADADDDVRV